MRKVSRFTIATGMLALAWPALGQNANPAPTDLSGEWRRLTSHEDAHERGGGPDPSMNWGLSLNDAARMRADTYNGNWFRRRSSCSAGRISRATSNRARINCGSKSTWTR